MQVFAKGENDIPEWAKQHHDWEAATDVTKLKVRVDRTFEFVELCKIICMISADFVDFL